MGFIQIQNFLILLIIEWIVLSAPFIDASNTFINAIEKGLDDILKNQMDTILILSSLLSQAREEGKVIHTVGMGRSGLAGRFFADLLKLYRLKSSVLGDVLAKPVHKGDIVFAFSGSGWTNTTNLYAEMCIKRGAILVAFTATKGSKLDRLADYTLYLPGKTIIHTMDYMTRKIFGKYKSPLAPMGSITEFSAIVFSTGLASTINSNNPQITFESTVKTIISTCERSLNKIKSNQESLYDIIKLYLGIKEAEKTCYFSGLGLLEYIVKMIAIRFQHLGLIVGDLSDWILRKPSDVLTVVSCSGEAIIPKILAEEAKKSEMYVVAVVGNESSSIANIADISLYIEGIEERKRYFTVGRDGGGGFIPTFEISALMVFEAIVAELANRLGLTEDKMRELHANIE